MNDFETELRELVEKHRDHPGADYHAMFQALENEAIIMAGEMNALGPFAKEKS